MSETEFFIFNPAPFFLISADGNSLQPVAKS